MRLLVLLPIYLWRCKIFSQEPNELEINVIPVTKKWWSIPSCTEMLASRLTNLMVTSVSSSKCRHKFTINGNPPKLTMSASIQAKFGIFYWSDKRKKEGWWLKIHQSCNYTESVLSVIVVLGIFCFTIHFSSDNLKSAHTHFSLFSEVCTSLCTSLHSQSRGCQISQKKEISQ